MKKGNSRRSFIKNVSLATVSTIALSGCGSKAFEDFLQQNFRTLTKEEKDEIVKNLELKYKEKYGKEFHVSDNPAIDGTLFGYALDLSRCVGCRKCVYACVKENNQSREPQIHWIEVLQIEKEKGIDFADSNVQYNPEKVPEKGYFYVPVQCQQCRHPQCTTVCPVKATWQEPDGIVVVDYNWCIGCRYCVQACPYGCRFIHPVKKVANKCTLCYHRLKKNLAPACMEVCPTGARMYGNLRDKNSDLVKFLKEHTTHVLRANLNTGAKLYYNELSSEVR